jgi:hypothetical protein
VASITGIPMPYYRKLQNAPELMAQNVNHWWPMKETRFVRTYDMKEIRAVLSDKYKPMEDYDVAEIMLPHLHANANRFRVKSANLTERRFYLQFVDTELEAEIQVTRNGRRLGEVVEGGFMVSNSEIGEGAFTMSAYINVLSCLNGMVRDASMRKVHLGKKLGNGHIEIYSDETRRKEVDLFRSQVKDALNYGFDRDAFRAEVAQFQLAADNTFKPSEAEKKIKDVTDKFSLTKADGKSILDNLFSAGDFSQWGLAQAVTAMVHNIDDADLAIDLEKIGGKIIG